MHDPRCPGVLMYENDPPPSAPPPAKSKTLAELSVETEELKRVVRDLEAVLEKLGAVLHKKDRS